MGVRLCIVGMMVSLCGASAGAGLIDALVLRGGNGEGGSWVWNGQGWNTSADSWYILGVSADPGGALLNNPNKTIADLPLGTYWLYSEPTALGANPRLGITFSDSGTLDATFALSGTRGTENTWTRTDGSDRITLGWAQGTADKVGPWASQVPSGTDDQYLKLTVQSVPEPASLLLLGMAAALVGLRPGRRQETRMP